MRVALIHYATPPVVGGVESVLSRQAELFSHAGHQATIVTGRGAAWNERIPVTVIPRFDSRHPEILELKTCLDRGEVPADFEQVVAATQADLQETLAGVDVVIAHNVASLHKNLALTAALYRFSQTPGNSPPDSLAPRPGLDCAALPGRAAPGLALGPAAHGLAGSDPGGRFPAAASRVGSTHGHLRGTHRGDPGWGRSAGISCEFPPEPGPCTNGWEWQSAQPLLLTPVRLTPRKNLEQGLRILQALRTSMPEAQLVITGPPGAHNPKTTAYFRDLRDLRQSLGLNGAVHFLAESRPAGLDPQEVVDFYHLADALLLTSREEGFGIPILEAGLARLPIFCTAPGSPARPGRGMGDVFFTG